MFMQRPDASIQAQKLDEKTPRYHSQFLALNEIQAYSLETVSCSDLLANRLPTWLTFLSKAPAGGTQDPSAGNMVCPSLNHRCSLRLKGTENNLLAQSWATHFCGDLGVTRSPRHSGCSSLQAVYQTPNFQRCQSGPHPKEPDISPTSMQREAVFHFLPSCVSLFKCPQFPTSESPWITCYLNEPIPRLPWLLTFLNDES